MKPKFRSLAAAFAPLSRSSLIVCASLCAATANADQTWTGAADALWATIDNWSGAALPGNAENAVFDASSTANLSIDIGGNRSVGGIVLGSPAGPVSISNNVLTIGRGGIDMSAATRDLTINSAVTAADGGKQLWNVNAGRTLTLATRPTKATASACPIQVSTSGSVVFGTETTNLLIDTANNPFVNLGPNDWAGTNSGTVVASTYTDATTALVGGAVNDIKANLTGANGTDVAAVRFNEPEAYDVTVSNSGTSRTMTGRGILVTANSAGGSIGRNLRNNAFLRPNRTSGNPSFNIIQNSASDFTIGAILGNASSGVAVRLVKTGPGKLILLQNNGYSAGTFIDQGTIQFGNGSAVSGFEGFGFPGSGNIVNNGSLVFNRTTENTLVNNISGTGDLTQAGTGTLNLTTSVSTFTGPVNINAGALGVTTMDNLGSGTDININGGALKFLGVIDPSTRAITLGAAGATFDTNGNDITLGNALNPGSTGALIKTGAGSLSLAADNDYSGGTTVNAGTLLAEAPVSSTGSGAVVVNSGAAIGGTGAMSGLVNISTGGILTPGAGVGSLKVGKLDLDSGSAAVFEFNTGIPQNDQAVVADSGGLTIDGGAMTLLDVTGATVAFATPGTYNLISYLGTIGGAGVSSLSVANPQPGFGYTFGTSGGFVTLTIATTGVVSKWINDGSGSWPTGSNWSSTVPNEAGAAANFTTVLSGLATVTLDGGKTVGALTFLSGNNGYTIAQGSGGSLVLNNGLDESVIANNDGNHEISASVTLSSNTGISTAAADDSVTLSGVVSGGATLTKTGPGELGLLGDNDFTGKLTLNGGVTTFVSGGLGTGDLDISGASLRWAGSNTQDISSRGVTFGSNPVGFDTNGNDVTLANSIGGGGSAAFTKAGEGRLTLAADAAFTGDVTIGAGVLRLGTGGATGLVTGNIVNNGQLNLDLADGTAFPNVISGTGSLVHSGTGALMLNAANTFAGTTAIPESTGSIVLGNGLDLQNSTVLNASAGGSLSFGTLVAATLGGLNGDKDLVLENTTPEAVALTIGNNGQPTTYSGILSGPGSLTKVGAEATILSGANTYAGNTTVSGGTLELAVGGEISCAVVAIGNNSTLALSDPTSSLISGVLSNVANNTGSAVLSMLEGTANFNAGIQALGNANTLYRIQVDGGTFTASSVSLGRGSLAFTTEGAAVGSATQGLYINGGTVNITGALNLGVVSGANSSVSTLLANGFLNVAGPVTVGLNNGGRWSVLQVAGGEFNSTDTATGLILGGPFVGNAVFAMSSGLSTVERIQFGQGILAGTSLVRLSGGELYVGAGGCEQASPNVLPEIRLGGGLLGAKADWSTGVPVTLAGLDASVIKTANVNGDPFNIALNGAISGTGGLDKDGTGTLTLAGGHSYLGNTTVLKGALKVQTKTFDDAATVGVELAAGATLDLAFSGGDLVAGFKIDGTALDDGIYGSLTNATPGITQTAAITGPGLLYVNVAVPASGFDNWASSNGLTTGNNGPNDDPDNDGIDNLLEFVLGGLPLVSSTDVLPDLVVNANNFVFTFNRNDDSEAEVALVFQYGSNLTGWTDVTIGGASAPADANGVSVDVSEGIPATNPDAITVTVPRTQAVSGKLFGRMKAQK